MKSALLLSGGLDSIALGWWMRPDLAVTIDYGQTPAEAEVRAASAASKAMDIPQCVIRVDMGHLGSGNLAGKDALDIAKVPEWWPFRNQMLVTLAAMKCIGFGVERLLIGTLSSDARHADGRSDFIQALDGVLQLQEGGIRLEAPAIEFTAPDLIIASGIPYEILAWAHSCHAGNYACGTCRGCLKHYETLEALGLEPL